VPIVQAVVLAVVQGLTEFFPVSSSGHLVLTRWLFGWDPFVDEPQLELAFDVAVHLGTLAGAIAYFRKDLVRYARAGLAALVDADRRHGGDPDASIAWLLVLATVPAVIVGVFFIDSEETLGSNIAVVAVALIAFGLLLGWADRRQGERPATSWRVRDALAMGVGQALALQPGVSRSGATITVARMMGFNRDAAARLAFLMAIPVIAGAGVYSAIDVFGDGGVPDEFRAAFAVGFVVSALTGWVAVWATLRIVRTRSFDVFVVYRVAAGLFVLGLLATPWRS
jgi:undecaprenyl-diphosphatase